MFTLAEHPFAQRIMKYLHVCSLEVTFATRIVKYQQFHPRGKYFYSTYNEILTLLFSGGDFYYTYNEISIFSPSWSVFLLYMY